jgi:hypothetical protein
MPNLLPEYIKRKIRGEYRLRVVVFGLGFTLIGIVAGFISLIPSYILLNTEYDSQLRKKDVVAEMIKVTQGDSYISALKDTTVKIAVMQDKKTDTGLLDILTMITGYMAPGIKLQSIDLTRSDGTGHLVLVGTATTREALVSFKNNLETEKLFTSVSHSISDLIKAQDLDFTLTISGKF